MWAADPCPKFEVPKSAVKTLGLPEISRPSFDGENQAPVAKETTPGMIVSSICKENIFAVQFHPEKSQHDGLRIYKNFISWEGGNIQ